MLKELLQNETWETVKNLNNFKVDWKKPFQAQKILIQTEAQRDAIKQKGIYDPFSISGSKAKKIVKEWKHRFREIFTLRRTTFDKESQTRMKWGAISEELVMKEIIPFNLDTPYWHDKVIVLDKRRYTHPDYPFISVEYDALVYTVSDAVIEMIGSTRPELKEDGNRNCWVVDPQTKEDYDIIDEMISQKLLVPFMIMDLKNTQNDILQNTRDYKYQLNLGMWMSPEFKYWSILGFIQNAKVEYYIQVRDDNVIDSIFNTYNNQYLPLVLSAMNLIEKEPENQEDNLILEFNDWIKDTAENEIDLGFGVTVTTNELTPEVEQNAIELMRELIELQAEKKSVTTKVDHLVDKIKKLQLPLNNKLFAQNDVGKISWSKYKQAGSKTFNLKSFNNYLYEQGLLTEENKVLTLIKNDKEKIEIDLDSFMTEQPDTIKEFPRFTPSEETKLKLEELEWN